MRGDLFAIYGFAVEISRVPNQVTEPTLGEIRLKWWSDALENAITSGGGETPALRAAAAAINRLALPIAPFTALVEARSADLYSDPPKTLTDLEGRMGGTESVLFQMAAMALGAAGAETADAAGHAGIAYGLARRLAVFASDRARGRTIVPATLLAERRMTAASLFSADVPEKLPEAIEALAAFASGHLGHARDHLAGTSPTTRPAFLPLAVVAPLLDRIRRAGPALTGTDIEMSNLESLSRMGLARLFG